MCWKRSRTSVIAISGLAGMLLNPGKATMLGSCATRDILQYGTSIDLAKLYNDN
jgi:hypothetical protein